MSKVIQVCAIAECDKKPHKVKVKTSEKFYCCFKGFQQSLADFQHWVATGETPAKRN